jgi:hypothetical protein
MGEVSIIQNYTVCFFPPFYNVILLAILHLYSNLSILVLYVYFFRAFSLPCFPYIDFEF